MTEAVLEFRMAWRECWMLYMAPFLWMGARFLDGVLWVQARMK